MITATGTLEKSTYQKQIPVKPMVLFHLYFRPNSSYDGYFGFDWMREVDLRETDYKGKCRKNAELEAEFETIEIVEGRKYYVPWLCMFPKHDTVIGKPVELIIRPDVMQDGYDNIKSGDYVEIMSPSSNLRIENSTMTDLYNVHIIKVHCDNSLLADDCLEARLFKGTSDKVGRLVGKLNVVKNDKKYDVALYVVNNFCTDLLGYTKADLDALININGGLDRIVNFLNKRSFNQALIQVHLKKTMDLGFREISLKTASSGVDPYQVVSNALFSKMYNASKKEVESSKYLHYIHSRFSLLNSKLLNEKCIFLYLTTMKCAVVSGSTTAGSAVAVPLDNKHCIIYRNYIGKDTTIAHEMGHILGLDHTFLDKDNVQQEIELDKEKENGIRHGKETESKYTKFLREHSDGYLNSTRYNNDEGRQKASSERKLLEYLISYGKALQKDTPAFIANNNIRFDKNSTDNIMDYSSNRVYFSKKQWGVMQGEVLNNHGEVK